MVQDALPAFPFAATDPLEPPEEYDVLREASPVVKVVLPSSDPAWLVLRHADVRNVLADPRFSRAAITRPGAPRILPIAKESKSIFVMDPPEHGRLRRLVSRAFSSRRIEGLRPQVQAITDELLDALTAPADLIDGLAQPLPIMVICEILGVPYGDVDRFRQWTDLMLNYDPKRSAEVVAARDSISGYLRKLIAIKRREPADDLLTALVGASDDGDRLSEDELLAFGYTLLGAGYHTTTSTIAHAVLTLLRDREKLARLVADPARIPAAVDELLRRSQAGGGIGALRIAVEDVHIGGTLIRKGEAVLPLINAANRDSEVFADPHGVELDRSPNPHLAFGHGIHHCLGAQLGKTELEIALGTLLRRFPRVRLACDERDLAWNARAAFSRPDTLPITW